MYRRRAALYKSLGDIMWSNLCESDKQVMLDIITEQIAEEAEQERSSRASGSLSLVYCGPKA